MSSHHFVKEGQEPALIIANGMACSRQLMDELLEWSPYVLVLDGALKRVMDLGIKFDAVLGDFDSLGETKQQLGHYEPLEILHRPDQDKTDLEKALDFLLEEKQIKGANILWAGGYRNDHHLNNLFTLAKYGAVLNLCMYDDYTRCFRLPMNYRKHYQKGQILSLMPIGQVQEVNTRNLKYNLQNFTLNSIERTGSSNEVEQTGVVEIKHRSGALLLMEAFEISPYQR
jgi:thiamine pyrophosphokinase